MKKVLLTSICILCVYPNILFSGEIYKWVDDKGVAHYSDSPTENSNFEKIDVEIIPAIKYVEPVPQISDDPISQISGVPVSQTNEKLVSQIEEKTDDKALQQKKQITIKKKVIVSERIKNVLPYIKNGEIQNKPINNVYRNEMIKNNERIQQENEARRREYEKARKKVESHNAQVREYNAQLNNNGNKPDFIPKSPPPAGMFPKSPPPKTKDNGRKPYLGDDDPNRSYFERHPLSR